MDASKIDRLKKKRNNKEHRSSYYLMLNNITNDLDLLLAEFCDLPFSEQGEPPPTKNKPIRSHGKKPMLCENQSGFGGSSTDGTLTSTDSNVSNKDVANGTLTSTDSNASSNRQHNISLQSNQFDVFGYLHNKVVEGVPHPDRQPSPSRSTSGSNLRQITVLERLQKTVAIWYLSQVGRSGAVHLLKDRDVGIFIVRKSSREDVMALSVQFPSTDGSPNIDHYLIEPTQHGYHLQGSSRLFDAIPTLIAYYCDHKEDLPHRLVLPPAVQNAKTSQELAALAMLGQDFWTSSKYHAQSRSSSRSDLSEHSHASSAMNKSQSEPINIGKAPVTPYSQSDAIPPTRHGIDFSSYLIQKRGPLANMGIGTEHVTLSCVQGASSTHENNVQSRCSTSGVTQTCLTKSESKTFSHVTSQCSSHVTQNAGHVTQTGSHVTTQSASHVTKTGEHTIGCNSCQQGRESPSGQQQKEWVLHVNPTENRVDIQLSNKRDSVASVPYAKPNKGANKIRNSYSSPQCLDTLQIPDDEYYFRSNLSDKMSDYEDIWKNNYADPKVSVQTDILTRLYPNVINSPRSPTSMTVESIEFHSGEMFTEQWHSDKRVVKDLNVSLEKLNISKECSNKTDITVSSSSQSRTQTSSESSCVKTHFSQKSSSEYRKTTQSETKQNQHNIAVSERLEGQNGAQYPEKRQSIHVIETIHEQESDLDSDSNHGDGCHSDNSSGEADTEDCDDHPKINTKQTQTSPMWKLKSPPFNGARKSVSTSSLSTLKTPVYSEPFDAISPEEKAKGQSQKVMKKRRRQSAPAIGMVKTRHPSAECNKLPPFLGEDSKFCDDDEDKFPSTESDRGKSDDAEDVFEISLEQRPLWKATPDSNDQNVGQYETAWIENKIFPEREMCRSEKPRPIPRKQKGLKKPTLVQTAVANDRNVKEFSRLQQKNAHNLTTGQAHVIDPMEFLEDFDENHNPSSPTLRKFPVYSSQVIDEPVLQYNGDGSIYMTAEDIIALSNPELTLRPALPFPPSGPHSEYDNLHAPYISPSLNSAGTIFQTPWDQGMAAKIMSVSHHNNAPHFPMTPAPNSPAPPPLPTIDPNERIMMWQQSSQKYSPCVPLDIEDTDAHRRSVASDILPDDAANFGDEKMDVYDFQVSSNGQNSQSHSDRTLVNEKGTTHSDVVTERNSETIPVLGTDFREKNTPILTNPRLLHQLNRNRNPDRVIREYIINLSKDKNTTFGSTIENFIQCTKESHDTNPHNITRNVRQFMNGIKNYLVKHGEGELEDLIERERNQLGKDEIFNIDAIIEGALHVCVIKPLKQCICTFFVNEYSKNGNLSLLKGNIKYARTKTAEEIGIRKGLTPPDSLTLELIKHYFERMQISYSPLKKLEHLLSATSAIYKCVAQHHKGNSSPPAFGADDFLPMLIYVLVQCGTMAVEIEADYMWGLLHPSLLTGEGGYYLTSLSSAVLVLKNFKEMQETKASQKLQGKLPSISDMQGFLKVAIPDEQHGTIVWPTLPVRPSMTTRDVCSLIAHKFKITNPQDYGLYTLENGEEHKLMDLECPQSLKADRLSHKKECIFTYKRNAANIAWPKSVR